MSNVNIFLESFTESRKVSLLLPNEISNEVKIIGSFVYPTSGPHIRPPAPIKFLLP